MSISQTITSRRDMLNLFGARIQNTHTDLVEDTKLEFGRNMLKTAIIESNIEFDRIEENDSVREVFEIESDLKLVEVENSKGDGWLFFDIHDKRFWIIFSVGKSKFFNAAIDDFYKTEGGGLDRLWIPTGQIEEIGALGQYEGIKLSYGATDVFPEEFIEDNLEFTDLNINSSGKSASHLYNILKNTDEVEDFLALSRIKINRQKDGEFVRESITNEGAFTTRNGSDIGLHISTVENVKQKYEKLLNAVEDNHVIRAEEKEHGARSRGGPVVINFSRPVPDIEKFLDNVINAKDPFRLWGHIRKTGDKGYKVDGVDAHNGDKIAIEMSPDWLRLYLYDGACGNTALRLFTNIQQYYDTEAELIINNA